MERGYALANGNYSAGAGGFGFHGHDGGMPGGLAILEYLPEYGLGYVLMINSDNLATLRRIVRLTRNFLIQDLEPPTLPAGRVVPAATAEEFEGVYRIVTVRSEIMRSWMRLISVVRLSIDGEQITLTPLLPLPDMNPTEYVAISNRPACSCEPARIPTTSSPLCVPRLQRSRRTSRSPRSCRWSSERGTRPHGLVLSPCC